MRLRLRCSLKDCQQASWSTYSNRQQSLLTKTSKNGLYKAQNPASSSIASLEADVPDKQPVRSTEEGSEEEHFNHSNRTLHTLRRHRTTSKETSQVPLATTIQSCHRHEMCSNKSTRRVTCVVEFDLIGADSFLVIRCSRAQKKWFPL